MHRGIAVIYNRMYTHCMLKKALAHLIVLCTAACALEYTQETNVTFDTHNVEVTSSTGTNVALHAVATAQSTFPGYSASRVNDGNISTTVGGAYSWANALNNGPDGYLPQWLQLDFGSTKTIDEIRLYTSASFEIKDYDLQYWNGSAWVTIADINNNTQDSRSHSFSPVSTTKIRVIARRGPDRQPIYVRINELQVFSSSSCPLDNWSWASNSSVLTRIEGLSSGAKRGSGYSSAGGENTVAYGERAGSYQYSLVPGSENSPGSGFENTSPFQVNEIISITDNLSINGLYRLEALDGGPLSSERLWLACPCNNNDPNKRYLLTSQQDCASVRIECNPGERPFGWDGCGCGCERI